MSQMIQKCRAVVGSKSDYVLHNATCSVAIVRHSEEALKVHDPLVSSGGTRNIFIAVDESKEVSSVLAMFVILQQQVKGMPLRSCSTLLSPFVRDL